MQTIALATVRLPEVSLSNSSPSQITLRTGVARKNGATLAAQGQDHSLSKHLATLIAKGEVRPGKGPRFLPRPIQMRPSEKTATDWVAEGRR